MSTRKGTSGVNKIYRKIPTNIKNRPKTIKTRPDWAKRLIQVSGTTNRVESGDISQTTKSLFPSVTD